MSWTDEKRQQAKELYLKLEPTPTNSSECVKEVAEEIEETPNGTRVILQKLGVYVKKEVTKAATSADGEKAKGTKVSKADAQNELRTAITNAGKEVDEDIITKLTGKAAQYLASVITD